MDRLFKAGADAMLEALREIAEKSVYTTRILDTIGAPVGYLVFIPEVKE